MISNLAGKGGRKRARLCKMQNAPKTAAKTEVFQYVRQVLV